MRKPSCIKAGSLIAARAAGLSSAEGLWLEEHTGGCEDCRHEASMLSGVRALAQSFEPELSIEARGRVLHSALRVHAMQSTGPRAPSMGQGLWGLTLASAVAVAVGWLTLRSPEVTAPVQAPSADLSARVLARENSRAQEKAAQAETTAAIKALQSGQRHRVRARTAVTLAHASVELAPQSEAQWNAQTRELSLFAGETLAEVDPSAHQSFAVVTKQFRAEVLGTRFEVSQQSVRVERGRVRVLTSDGVERALLGAGQRYDYGEAATFEPESAENTDATGDAQPKPRSREVNAYVLLTEARNALAAGSFDRCQQALDRVLAAKLPRSARAEALTLRAELLSAQKDRGAALAAYLDVAKRFSELPAGENALFAAVRMQGDASEAKALLERYLERYPQGRFVAEAKRRLDRTTK